VSDLEQLRTHLKTMEAIRETYDKNADFTTLVNNIRDRIAKLEAEAADPWADAKKLIDVWERADGSIHSAPKIATAYVRHLEAELESAKNCEIDENGHFVREIAEAEAYADESGHIVFPDDKAGADPWREAKEDVEYAIKHLDMRHIGDYIRHLEADNAKQAARIVALENDLKGETLAGQIIRDDLKARIAELEARPVPPLDPKRVIATACKVIAKTEPYYAGIIMQMCQAGDAGIYPLAGDET
jgi:hypothetical protein